MAAEVYIANLPDDVTEQIFRNKLKIFGDVSSVQVRKPQGLYQGKPKGKIIYKIKRQYIFSLRNSI